MIDDPYAVPAESPHEVHLAAELVREFAPACNKWLTTMMARDEPPKDVLIAACIAFATELYMTINMTIVPEDREATCKRVANNIYIRLVSMMRVTDVPPSPGDPNASIN
jgi:hypothetical protein